RTRNVCSPTARARAGARRACRARSAAISTSRSTSTARGPCSSAWFARSAVDSGPRGSSSWWNPTEEVVPLQYLALIYADEDAWHSLTDGERRAVRDRYMQLTEEMRDAGVLVGGDQLSSSRDATTVRLQEGETLVTDGPYAEVKEALGGYFLLECATLEDALEWAARIPAAERGAIEV